MDKKILISIVFFSVLISTNACAISNVSLENPKYLHAMIRQEGRIIVSGNALEIRVNVTLPASSEIRKASHEYTLHRDSFGNRIMEIQGMPENGVFSYFIETEVENRMHVTNGDFKIPKSIPENIKKFLLPTENIQSDDARIREVARNLTMGSEDVFEKIARIALWVNGYVKYDEAYSNKNYDALWVLKNARGVCAEYTTLFIAIARAAGIPARYVSAYAYGKNEWEPHAYAEVWAGRWIPVDALWMQVGWVDASHIAFGRFADNKVSNRVEAKGYGVRDIEWVEDKTEINIVDYRHGEKFRDFELSVLSKRLSPGDYGAVKLNFSGMDFRVVDALLLPCTGEYKVVEIPEREKYIISEQGRQSFAVWGIRINENLPENYLFTCPLSLNSRFLDFDKVTVFVSPSERKKGQMNCTLHSKLINQGEEQKVFIDVGENGEVELWMVDGRVFMEGISRGESIFSYIPEGMGKHKVFVFSSDGRYCSLSYKINPTGNLRFNFSLDDVIPVGERKNATLTVFSREKFSPFVEVYYENRSVSKSIDIDVPETFEVSFTKPGMKKIKLVVHVPLEKIEKNYFVEVYDVPEVYLKGSEKEGEAFLNIEVKRYHAFNVSVYVDGVKKVFREHVFGEETIPLGVESGFHRIRVTYKDRGGKKYEIEREINFRKDVVAKISEFFSWLLDSLNVILRKVIADAVALD